VYSQITELGALTGHLKTSQKLVESMKSDIKSALPSGELAARTYYYELDNTYYSITSNTFIGSLLSSFGLSSIADGVEVGNDYPQLNAESIISKSPDFIFLADTKCCAQTSVIVSARAGWNSISAVSSNRIIELDDDIASRWGPRIVDLVKQVAAAVNGK
jgi:iron complex transport system substrate-binding protein